MDHASFIETDGAAAASEKPAPPQVTRTAKVGKVSFGQKGMGKGKGPGMLARVPVAVRDA